MNGNSKLVTHESYDSILVGTVENGKVLSRCLKTASDGADATWRGRSFQTVAPETGNARLPTVERRTGGTSRRCEGDAEKAGRENVGPCGRGGKRGTKKRHTLKVWKALQFSKAKATKQRSRQPW